MPTNSSATWTTSRAGNCHPERPAGQRSDGLLDRLRGSAGHRRPERPCRVAGGAGRLDALDPTLKKQNPEDIEDKVVNFAEMEGALARLDRFNLGRTPTFEPRRQAGIPGYLAAGKLIYMPVRGGPEAQVPRGCR